MVDGHPAHLLTFVGEASSLWVQLEGYEFMPENTQIDARYFHTSARVENGSLRQRARFPL